MLGLRFPEAVSGFSGSGRGHTQWLTGPQPCKMQGMAAQINEIAITAKGFLLDPVLLIVPAILIVAIMTGFVGRVALVVEDLLYGRIQRRNG